MGLSGHALRAYIDTIPITRIGHEFGLADGSVYSDDTALEDQGRREGQVMHGLSYDFPAWWRAHSPWPQELADLSRRTDGYRPTMCWGWQGFRIGDTITAAQISMARSDAAYPSGDWTQLRLAGSTQGQVIIAPLKSDPSLAPAGTNPMLSGLGSMSIAGRAADHYSATLAVPDAPHGGLVCYSAPLLRGSDAAVPSLTIPYSSTLWGGATAVVTVALDGETAEFTIFNGATQTEIYTALRSLEYTGGRHLTVTRQTAAGRLTGWTLAGNLAGSAHTLTVTGPAPYQGTATGLAGGLQTRLVAVTGTGPTAVRTPLTPLRPYPQNTVPLPSPPVLAGGFYYGVRDCAVIRPGFTGLQIHARLPARQPSDPPYASTLSSYAIAYAPAPAV